MVNIWTVILFSLIGGVISLVGGFALLSNKAKAKQIAEYATPFAAGALLSAALLDLLSEANHKGSIDTALFYALVGITGFFLLERFLHWFHHHHDHTDKSTDPTVSLIVIGDTLHNFIDGIAIAAGFLVGFPSGVVVTFAVAMHEIPQEIGDFGLLMSKGLARRKIILVNIMSALATTIAAIVFYSLGGVIDFPFDAILGLVSGFFLYIALSDIIPSIHKKSENSSFVSSQTALLLAGILVVGIATNFLHGIIDPVDNHHSNSIEQKTHEHSDHHDH